MKLVQMPQNWGKLVRNGALAFALGIGLLNRPAMADVDFTITMNYDVTGTGQYGQYYDDFRNTFDTIEGMLQTWSGPRAIESLYDGFTIDITFDAVDGTGGVIAFAGPTDILRWGGDRYAKGSPSGAVARAGAMTMDVDDIAWTLQSGTFDDVIMHEAFHALGFGTLWDDFRYRDPSGLGYIGPEALKQYRLGTNNPYAMFVPLEASGGGGTAGGHWDSRDKYFVDPSKDRYENMVGFNYGVETFVSDVTLGQFRDLGYGVPGLDGGLPGGDWPDGSGPTKPWDPSGDDDDGSSRSDDDWGSGDDDGDTPWNPGGGSGDGDGWVDYPNGGWGGFSAVPEPGSATVLAAVSLLGALGVRRRRS